MQPPRKKYRRWLWTRQWKASWLGRESGHARESGSRSRHFQFFVYFSSVMFSESLALVNLRAGVFCSSCSHFSSCRLCPTYCQPIFILRLLRLCGNGSNRSFYFINEAKYISFIPILGALELILISGRKTQIEDDKYLNVIYLDKKMNVCVIHTKRRQW